MPHILDQFLTWLVTDNGSLTYHLVLAFSIAGALYTAIGQSAREDRTRWRRLALGLGFMLALQFALFVLSAIAGEGLISGEKWMPLIDRSVTLMSLLFIVWLWAFSHPSPPADAATLLLVLLIVTALILGGLWWSGQEAGQSFNASIPDIAYQISCLVVIFLGCIFLSVRRPDSWGLGVTMLVLLGVGHIVHLLFSSTGDYPGAVRLAQIAAFSFLFVLPQRLVSSSPLAPVRVLELDKPEVEVTKGTTLPDSIINDDEVMKALEAMSSESDQDRLYQGFAQVLARLMHSDICLIAMPPGNSGKIKIQCGYNLHHQNDLDGQDIDIRMMPMLASALRTGRIRHLPTSAASPDGDSLARAFNLKSSGAILFAPILSSRSVILSVILLSPFSGHDWNAEEQALLNFYTKLLVQFLHRNQNMLSLKEEIKQLQRSVRLAQDQARLALDERQKLFDQLAVYQSQSAENWHSPDGLQEYSGMQPDVQRELETLRSENVTIKEQAQQTISSAAQKQRALQEALEDLQEENRTLKQSSRIVSETAARQEQIKEEELRLALEELALLKNSLEKTEKRVIHLKSSSVDAKPTDVQLQSIVSIAQDLRQPLSSILGYADYLLSEQAGILVDKQRKYLERIKVSTERLNHLADDLVQTSLFESGAARLTFQEADLCAIVQQATDTVRPRMRGKGIKIELDIPSLPLWIQTDENALLEVIIDLLTNAGAVTPTGGCIGVKTRLDELETNQEFMLIQIVDQGGGIALEDLPHIFLPRTDDQAFAGLSHNIVNFPGIKTLVEALGGRAWVDSEQDQGSTFSVLLPVEPPVPVEKDASGVI